MSSEVQVRTPSGDRPSHAQGSGSDRRRHIGRFARILYSQKAAPYFFIAPFVITVLAFWTVPLIRAFIISGQEVLYGDATFVGLDNYRRLWGDRVFWQAMFNSLRYMMLTLLLLIPIPMVLAAIINAKLGSDRSKAIFKSAMFVPALTSGVRRAA